MNILIAPDSFKGSLSANQIIDIFNNKFDGLNAGHNIITSPLADGGEGSLDVILSCLDFPKIKLKVLDPLLNEIEAFYLFDKKTNTAYIEMAKASGLALIDKPDVKNASSTGTGQLIKHALLNGAQKIVLFVGGSATNDAAMGIATALGLWFTDKQGAKLKPMGKNLLDVQYIDDKKSLIKKYPAEIIIAADVNNPFYGKNGAAFVYAPQKGASGKEAAFLDKGLQNMANIFKNNFQTDVQNIKGSGAAGGIAGGMMAMFNAQMVSGADLIFKLNNIEQKIKQADLLISGEGKIDSQTLNDKLIFKLSQLAALQNKKIWAVCGYFDGGPELKKLLGIEKIFSLAKSKNEINEAIENAETKLSKTAEIILEEIKSGY